MKDLTVLRQRELRALIAPNVPVQYRSLAAVYWTDLLAFLQRERLLVIRADAETHAHLMAHSDSCAEVRLI